MSEAHAEHAHKPNVKLYMAIFGALMVLTVVTVLVSYWHLPPAAAIALGLFIAAVKASLVMAFFMHLKGERAIIFGLLGVTAFFLLILFWLPIKDSTLTHDRRFEPPSLIHGHGHAETPAPEK
jgi:cytochrome c oxidase subunit IV